MPDFSDPEVVLTIAGLILVNTVTLGVLVAIFRPGEHGFFARWGSVQGWGTCLLVSLFFCALGLVELPFLVAVPIWWVIALGVFGLTLRQAIKLSYAQTLIYIALVFGIAAVLGEARGP